MLKRSNKLFYSLFELFCTLHVFDQSSRTSKAIWTPFSESTHAHYYRKWGFFDVNVGSIIILQSAECEYIFTIIPPKLDVWTILESAIFFMELYR